MSHFTVIVIGEDHEKQLAPYHEFECTGLDDEYVQEVDKTEDALADYSERTHAEDGRTAIEWASDWYGVRVVDLDAGEIPDTSGPDKYGWVEVANGGLHRVVRRTNPNAKWDWYSVGGRWTGYFPLNQGATGATGSPGLMTEKAKPGTADQCRWGDVDMTAARDRAQSRVEALWDKWEPILAEHGSPESWESIRARVGDTERARAEYWSQPSLVAARGFVVPDEPDRQAAITKARRAALVPFAVVRDGEWYEKGRMGWWALVSDEMDESEWLSKVAEMFDNLDPDTTVTLVDCHI